MDANEARQKATEVFTNGADSQYGIIKNMIKEAANKGKFSCHIYHIEIEQSVRNKLAEEGFTVGPLVSSQNETLTRISW